MTLFYILIDFYLLFSSLKLMQFEKFEDTTQALAAVTATVEGKISKPLKKLLKRLVDPEVQEQLLVADSALGKAIKVCLFFLLKKIYIFFFRQGKI